ncbi:MAG TPA: chemotaxis response regulator protein-glutamate methylesterase [Actinomycetes bacterium]|nr:chemotaxis response regulator protein-glutamate methylesterase [Actinomycetes bacterium]
MGQISVLVVDDSVVVRRLVTTALEEDPAIRVIGTASNGRLALAKIDQLAPDIVTLDVEMPELDGVATLRALRVDHPRLPVIMFSTVTERGARATLDALTAGATDYVTKPANMGSVAASLAAVREQLVPRIKALCPRDHAAVPTYPRGVPAAGAGLASARTAPRARAGLALATRRPEILAIGASTGGPEALTTLLGALPADLPVPVVVVQHMPAVFTRLFAERLNRSCAIEVGEAGDGQPLRPGVVYLAPGDHHLEVVGGPAGRRTRLTDAPPENYCRPAVDVLFRSVAKACGAAALGLVLTGMGADGRRGAEQLREEGAAILVQDAATSVVWGMPGAVAAAGLADAVLPLGEIAAAVLSRVRPSAVGVTR